MAKWKTTSIPMPQGRDSLCMWAFQGRLYICGGKTTDGSTFADRNILAARYGHDGDLVGPWEVVGQLPTQLIDAGTYMEPGSRTVYLDSGFDPGAGFAPNAGILVLKISTDGRISSLTKMPSPRSTAAGFTTMTRVGNFLHESGFNSPGSPQARFVFRAPFADGGAIGAWSRGLDALGDMCLGVIGSSKGVLVALHEKFASAANAGNTAFPCQIDWAVPGGDGSFARWNTLTTNFAARAFPAMIGISTGVLFAGGYQTADNITYVDLKEVWLVPVSSDRTARAPVRLPSLNTGRDSHSIATDGRFVWVAGGEDPNGTMISSIEVLDTNGGQL